MKKQRLGKAACSLFAAFLLVFCGASGVLAADTPDFERSGSITVGMNDLQTKTPVSGGWISLFRVGDPAEDRGRYYFTLSEEFNGSGLPLDDVASAELAQELADYAEKESLSGSEKSIGSNGKAVYTDLQTGLYLVVQTQAAEGYDPVKPFLVTLPLLEDGVYLYDVDASPKTGVNHPGGTTPPGGDTPSAATTSVTVKKVWDDGGGDSRPEDVTVQLLRGETVVGAVTLSEQNGWSHTWRSLAKSSSYSVREVNVPEGYTASYEQSGSVFTILNTAKKPAESEPDESRQPADGPAGTTGGGASGSAGGSAGSSGHGAASAVQNAASLLQTGQLIWPIPVLAAAGLLLITGGWLLYRRKKDGE